MSRRDGVPRAPGTGISGTTVALVLGLVLALSGVIVLTRQQGLPKQVVSNLRGTRWMVYEPLGLAVLADAVTGRVVVQLDAAGTNDQLVAVQGDGGAYLINRNRGEAITIDEENVRLDAGRAVPSLVAESRSLVMGVGPNGAVAASVNEHTGVLVPPTGQIAQLELPPSVDQARVATDGAIWGVDRSTGDVFRLAGGDTEIFPAGAPPDLADDISLTTVGTSAVVLDRGHGTLRWLPSGTTVDLPSDAPNLDAVLQEPGPDASCAWVGRLGELLCIGSGGVERTVPIDSFVVERNDRLGVTTGYALVVRGATSATAIRLGNGATQVVPVDWNQLTEPVVDVDRTGIWLDDPRGQTAFVVTAQGVKQIQKADPDAPRFGEDGKPISGDDGERIPGGVTSASMAVASADEPPPPDDDGIQEAPVANDDTTSSREGGSVPINVAANDFDPDGDPITVVSATEARNGSVDLFDSAVVVYTPAPGFTGVDSFTYTISDPGGLTDSAEVTVEILRAEATNLKPIALNDTAETAANRAVVIDVLGNDIDPERTPLSIASIDPPDPAVGTVERTVETGGRAALRFVPAGGFAGGTANFSYRAVDADGGQSDSADVSVIVAAADAPNRDPIARPDAGKTRRGQRLLIPVLENDEDPDNDQLVITEVRLVDPRHGDARRQGEFVQIVPAASAPDQIAVEYTVSDGHGGTDVGDVLVTVLPDSQPNGAPLAVADEYSFLSRSFVFDPTLNDRDPDNDALTVISVTQPDAGGTTALVSGNQVSFVPQAGRDGISRFSYTITDGHGHETVGQVQITVLQSRRPDGPTAVDDQAQTTVDKPVTIDVLANDSDPTGDELTIDGQPNCQYGTCRVNPDGTITFTPPSGTYGTYRFFYRVRNSVGQTAQAAVAVQVQQPAVVNAPPVALADQADVTRGDTTEIKVLENDQDENPGSLRITNVTTPSSGTAQRVDRVIRFTSASSGPDVVAFQYTVQDDAGRESTATVTVRILPKRSTPPVALPDTRETLQGRAIDVDVIANDNDDGPREELRLSGSPSVQSGSGTATRLDNRTIRVEPNASFVGQIVVRYEVEDRDLQKAAALLTVNVRAPVNTAPVAVDDGATTNQNVPVSILVLENDTDAEGDQLTVEITSAPSAATGTVGVIGGKTVQFTPAAEFSGPATFQYRAVDSKGLRSASATVRVNVLPCSQGIPLVRNIDDFTAYATPKSLDLLAPDQLDFGLTISGVSGGEVQMGPTPGNVVFVPAAGNNAAGSFSYTVANACGVQRTASVTIDVNRNPRFVPQSYGLAAGQTIVVPVAQIAQDDEVTLQITSASAGVIAPDRASLAFTGTTVGSFAVSVTVADPGGLEASGMVIFDVHAVVNVPPSASPTHTEMVPGSTKAVDVVSLATDPDGPSSGLTVEIVSGSAVLTDGTGGSISASVDPSTRQILVSASPDANGIGRITYRVVDQGGAPSNTTFVDVLVNRPPNIGGPGIPQFVEAGQKVDYEPVVSDPDGNTVTISNPQTSSPFVTAFMKDADRIRMEVADDAPQGPVTLTFTVTDTFGAVRIGSVSFNVIQT